ncbi:MAG: hypothetical protein WD071_03910, partial [Pseudohongiella sp.]|uniref:hypothetical protein n=1 Tax=Pseudohongiella sp. TaxID=1979412 RepID=UPI00349FECDB
SARISISPPESNSTFIASQKCDVRNNVNKTLSWDSIFADKVILLYSEPINKIFQQVYQRDMTALSDLNSPEPENSLEP